MPVLIFMKAIFCLALHDVNKLNKGLYNNYREGGGGALHKIAAKIAESKITHLTEGGALSFIRNVNKIKRNIRFSIQAS